MNGSRGVVILYEDLTERWIDWAREARLTHIGVHKIAVPGKLSMETLVADLEKPDGRKMIEKLEKAGLTVEYELHSLEWMLPRGLFSGNESLFRMNEDGVRTNDLNFCPSSPEAVEIIAENAYRLAKILRQNSHRYYLWPDDKKNGGCHCPACRERGITGTDGGMIYANAVAQGLRAYDSAATHAFLSYCDAKSIPTVKPAENVFLEFAPMDRDHDTPMGDSGNRECADYVRLLKSLLQIFPAETTHVLEYWMDNALYSGYKRPPVKVPLNEEVLEADVKLYASLGIRHIKSFSSYIDEEYYRLHGEPPVKVYGDVLAKYIY